MTFDISKINIPSNPGIYLMKNFDKKIIYIGKAKSLKKRLGSYIKTVLSGKPQGRGLPSDKPQGDGAASDSRSHSQSHKVLKLMSCVSRIDYRLTPGESMALLLEASLIHKYKPKYNVSWQDDKSFPLVKITKGPFPAVYVTRKKEQDGAGYFGPYTNAALLKEALKIIRRYFPYRSCKVLPEKACIYYRIKLSPAPCIGRISQLEYARTIKQISLILAGKSDTLIKELSRMMHAKAREQKFEEAAAIRDKLIALSTFRPSAYTPPSPRRFRGRQLHAVIRQLKGILGLKVLPRRIEAFDVSNIFGRQASASMVSFYNGLADKDNYRRFRIKTVKEINDYQMLAEAVSRRYKRVKEENLPLPDLILVDGGKGQLSAAKKELELLGLDIPVIGLAKKEELIYTLGRPKPGGGGWASDSPNHKPGGGGWASHRQSQGPIRLKSNAWALRLLQHIRDESHRFALSYHRILRKRHLFSEP
jgi:excinuclease ABC subunit C